MDVMKKRNAKRVLTAGLLATMTWLGSCEKDSEGSLSEVESREEMEVVALQQADEAEWIAEEVVNLAEEVYAVEELTATGKGIPLSGFIPECLTITTVRTNGVVEKTLDFGQGCETPNGNRLSGVVFLRYEADMEMATKTLILELREFTFNEIAVEGGAEILRLRSNAAGNPQSEVVSEFKGTWPDGEVASWEGNRTREWIEGYGSGFWGDNVFLITGSQTLIRRNDVVLNRTTISPLKRELSCRFLVSGLLQISRNDLVVELDFGDGSCDAFGVLTYPDGSMETITLRRFRP